MSAESPGKTVISTIPSDLAASGWSFAKVGRASRLVQNQERLNKQNVCVSLREWFCSW